MAQARARFPRRFETFVPDLPAGTTRSHFPYPVGGFQVGRSSQDNVDDVTPRSLGLKPDTSSQRITPNAYMSDATDGFTPFHSSGAMYAGVPASISVEGS